MEEQDVMEEQTHDTAQHEQLLQDILQLPGFRVDDETTWRAYAATLAASGHTVDDLLAEAMEDSALDYFAQFISLQAHCRRLVRALKGASIRSSSMTISLVSGTPPAAAQKSNVDPSNVEQISTSLHLHSTSTTSTSAPIIGLSEVKAASTDLSPATALIARRGEETKQELSRILDDVTDADLIDHMVKAVWGNGLVHRRMLQEYAENGHPLADALFAHCLFAEYPDQANERIQQRIPWILETVASGNATAKFIRACYYAQFAGVGHADKCQVSQLLNEALAACWQYRCT